MWQLESGPHQARLEAASRRAGRQLGAVMPVLYDDLERYWQAFMQLNLSRTSGYGGAEPLQPANVEAWLNIHGVGDFDERGRYYDFITELDMSFLKWQLAKRSDQDKSRTGKNGHN